MARAANPYTKVIKHLAKLQAKTDKLNAEIASFAKFVEAESKSGKPEAPTPKTVAKKRESATARKAVKATKPTGKGKKIVATTVSKPRGKGK